MRSLCLLAAAAAAVAGCSTAVPAPTRSAEAEAQFQRLIAGKAAGAPVSCVRRSADMVVIDDNLVAYRAGSKVYVNEFRGGSCNRLGSGFYALVTRSSGGGLCSGDIAQVMDLSTGTTLGSCALGDFVPYAAVR